jgi:GMP synthase-like glutamine amidotransferase
MTVGLLECDHVRPDYRHVAGDYRDMFAALLGRHAPALRLRPFDACNGALPPSVDACDAYLCTGSRFSVYDDVDWIHALQAFVRRLSDAGKPYVGICFGHQLLAEALGGQVAKAGTGWGVGVHPVEVVRPEPWMVPPQAEAHLPYLHQDQVVRLPEGAVLLGRSDHCPVALFRVGPAMLGVQAHPEFPPAYSAALLHDRIERIGAARTEAALQSLHQPTDEAVVTRWIAAFLAGEKVDAGTGQRA